MILEQLLVQMQTMCPLTVWLNLTTQLTAESPTELKKDWHWSGCTDCELEPDSPPPTPFYTFYTWIVQTYNSKVFKIWRYKFVLVSSNLYSKSTNKYLWVRITQNTNSNLWVWIPHVDRRICNSVTGVNNVLYVLGDYRDLTTNIWWMASQY